MTEAAVKTGKRKRQKVFCLFLAVLLCLCCLSGCGGKKPQLGEGELLSVDGIACTREEMMIYVLSQVTVYDGAGESIWSLTLGDGTFETKVRDATYHFLEQLFLMDSAAGRMGIVLSESEEQAAKTAARQYMTALGAPAAERCGITEEGVCLALERYLRARIFYQTIMHEDTGEISDEEARAIYLQIVEIDKVNGLQAAQTMLAGLQEEHAVSELLRGFEGVSYRKEIVTRGKYPDPFDMLSFSLRSGKWAPVIDCPDAFYLVQCLSANVAEETAANKVRMQQEAHQAILTDYLEALKQEVIYLYNPDIWAEADFRSLIGLTTVNYYRYAESLLPSD